MSIKLMCIFDYILPKSIPPLFYDLAFFICCLVESCAIKITKGRLGRHQPNHLALHLAHFKDEVRKLITLIKHLGFLLTNY